MSRSSVDEPVNAPKNIVLVSTATGAARTIVGVPTLPRMASTAFSPRVSAVIDTGVEPPIADAVDGQLGTALLDTWTSMSARVAASARSGWYESSRNTS